MENSEKLIAPTSEKKLPRPGSRAHIDSLKDQLDEILEWEQKIKSTKGKKGQELRKEFKNKFRTAFNVKLMEKLTGESRSLEKKEDPQEFIEKKSLEINKVVDEHKVAEKEEAELKGVNEDPKFKEESDKVNNDRSNLVKKVVDEAKMVAGTPKTSVEDVVVKEEAVKNNDGDKGGELEQTEEDLRSEILDNENEVMKEMQDSYEKELKEVEAEKLARDKEGLEDAEMMPSPENKKQEVYSAQTIESFKKLSLSPEDLETISGLSDLPEMAQMMIAKSLQSMAFERAKSEANQEVLKKMQGKGIFGRIGQSLMNSFTSKDRNRRALKEQEQGGLEKHGADLVRLVDWANTFIPNESINEKGEKQIDFISLPSNFRPSPEEKKVFDDLNKASLALASLPKHDLVKFDSVKKDSPEYEKAKQYYNLQALYNAKKEEAMNILIDNDLDNEKTANIKLSQADAKINMMQFLASDPNLEKEWEEMLNKDSFFKNAFKSVNKYTSDNAKFFTGGFAARGAVSMAFTTTFGVAAGVVAIPLAAAGIGAWRAKERANKKLKEQDKFVDKKTLYEHPVLVERKKALHELQSLLPMYSDLEGEESKKRPGRMSYEEWSKIASSEDLEKYQKAKAKFDKLDLKWQRTDNKNVEKKTLKSDNLTEKLQTLINKYRDSGLNDRDSLVGAIQRRLDFSKRLADDGLVNFGSIQERTGKMKDFYDSLNEAQQVLLNFDYDTLNLDYEIKVNKKTEVVKAQERAEDLISYFEDKAGKKLDKKRKNFIVKSMVKGAFAGAAAASLGSAAFGQLLSGGADSVAVAAEEATSKTGALASNAGEEIINTSAESPVIDKIDVPTESSSIAQETATSEAPVLSDIEDINPPTEASPTTSETMSSTEPILPATDIEEEIISETESAQSSWSDLISNEGLKPGQHDSVWRSTREIFLNNAESLGYEGDEAGLSKWAEIQTNRALANSGEVPSKVFEGNKVILEKVNDAFVVSVEQGDGLNPGQLPEITRVQPIGQMEILPGESIEEMAPVAPESSPEEVADHLIPSAKSLESSAAAINKWLSNVGAKLSLETSEMSYVGSDIVKTVIGGKDVFIDPVKNQYMFFNDVGEEVSGFLADSQGENVSDIKSFLADRFGLESINHTGEDSAENLNQFVNKTEASWSADGLEDDAGINNGLDSDLENNSYADDGIEQDRVENQIDDSAEGVSDVESPSESPVEEISSERVEPDSRIKAETAKQEVKEAFRASSERGSVWEDRDELFSKVDDYKTVESASIKDQVLETLNKKLESNSLSNQDKYIFEMIEQAGGQESISGSDLQEVVYLSSQEGRPDFQKFVDFFDLRNSSGEERINILNRMIAENLKLTDENHLNLLNTLQEREAFSVLSDINGEAKGLNFSLGGQSFSADFSVKGLEELSTLVGRLVKNE